MLITKIAFAIFRFIIIVSKLNVSPQFEVKNITQEVFERSFKHQVVPDVKINDAKHFRLKSYSYEDIY
jgi:hypothetical protein